jgi:HEAT repeat protein
MRDICVKHLLCLAFCMLLSGCADGPFAELAVINPYSRKEWRKDEAMGPTFHTQLAELRAIRRNPGALSPDEQTRVVDLLVNIVRESPNTTLRYEAVLALGEFASPKTVQTLEYAAAAEEPDLRIAACKALSRQGGPAALGTVAKLVETDTDLDVRLAATTELAKFQDQRAVQSLSVALNDKDPALQHQAVQSLKAVTGQQYGDSVPAWREYVAGRAPNPPAAPTIAERISRFDWF